MNSNVTSGRFKQDYLGLNRVNQLFQSGDIWFGEYNVMKPPEYKVLGPKRDRQSCSTASYGGIKQTGARYSQLVPSLFRNINCNLPTRPFLFSGT